MKNYSIDFFRDGRKGSTLTMRMEFPREHFTNREYKDYLIGNLLAMAAERSYYKYQTAVVMCNGEKIMTVRCDTKEEGAEITAYLTVARPREIFRAIRTVKLAC